MTLDGWAYTRLKNMTEINTRSLPSTTSPGFAFRYLDISNVDREGIISDEAIRDLEFGDAPSRARRCVSDEDVLVSSVRPNLQAIAHISDADQMVASTGFFVVSARRHKLVPRFCYYLMLSEGAKQYFEASATGVGYPAVGDKDFATLHFWLPSTNEQYDIVRYLDNACKAISGAIQAKQKQLDTLADLRKSIIHKAVTRGLDDSVELKDSGADWLGKIPKHWRCEHLKRLCSRIQTGSTPPTAKTEYYVDGAIPWFAPGSYDGGTTLTEPVKMINRQAVSDGKLRLFPAKSVFLVGIGATIGKVAMITVEASCNQQVTGLVCNWRVLPEFLVYQMKIYEWIIPAIAQFTTLPIMDQGKIGYLPVVVPLKVEQEAIVVYLDEKMEQLKKMGESLTAQIVSLVDYRKSLIHECVTGKRRITEADIEKLKEHA